MKVQIYVIKNCSRKGDAITPPIIHDLTTQTVLRVRSVSDIPGRHQTSLGLLCPSTLC